MEDGSKLIGKRHLGRPRRRYEGNITMNLKLIGFNMRIWVYVTYERNYHEALVNAALNLPIS